MVELGFAKEKRPAADKLRSGPVGRVYQGNSVDSVVATVAGGNW